MTTALTTSRAFEPPAFARPLDLSPALADALLTADMIVEGTLSSGHLRPSARDVVEARANLDRAEHLCRPADPRVIAQWMERLRALPFGPKTPDEAKAAVASAVAANGDLPASVWTAETAAEALRTFRSYPPPADVRELLAPYGRRFWRQRDGLRRIAEFQPETVPVRPEPSQGERDAVSELVRAFREERADQAEASAPARSATPAPLSDGHLLAVYERLAAEGSKGAAIRVLMLREKLS